MSSPESPDGELKSFSKPSIAIPNGGTRDRNPDDSYPSSPFGSHQENNFTMLRASEAFPRPSFNYFNNQAFSEVQIPFQELPGEGIVDLGRTKQSGLLVLTNYRLHVTPSAKCSIINVPLGLIDALEIRDLECLHIACKDAKTYRISFDGKCAEYWYMKLSNAIASPDRVEHIFALSHYAWGRENGIEDMENPTNLNCLDDKSMASDVDRLQFDVKNIWRISDANRGRKLCATYPEDILVPHSITNADLEKVAHFRSARRFPSIVWRHVKTGAVLARCSQPEVGWLGWRSNEDEKLVQAIAEACSMDTGNSSSSSSSDSTENNGSSNNGDANSIKDLGSEVPLSGDIRKVLIMDARSYAAAVGNRARGGGVECQEYYPNAEIMFMGLANIHTIRKSFLQMRSLLSSPYDQTSWLVSLDTTKWLTHISLLLKAAFRCAMALDKEGRPVIVHCSDGWDRTPQITSLAQLILDPYYRTFDGFRVLVEREWLSYGHKMADRCGNAFPTSDPNERSPIFLQWLDCVHQLLHQFPCHFEFNFTYLVKLGQHTYSNLFGNFLCNSKLERKNLHIREKTRSIWDFFHHHHLEVCNFIYNRNENETVIYPKNEIKDLLFWEDMYVSNQGAPFSVLEETGGVTPSSINVKSESESFENSREGSENGERESNGEEQISNEALCRNLSNLEVQENSEKSDPPLSDVSKSDSSNCLKSFKTLAEEDGNIFAKSTDTLVPEKDDRKAKPTYSMVASQHEMKEVHNFNSQKVPLPENNTASSSYVTKERLLQFEFLPVGGTHQPMGKASSNDPIDSDGLLVHHDRIQQRLKEFVTKQRYELQTLRRDLYYTRKALCTRAAAEASGDKSQQQMAGVDSLLLPSWDNEESSGVQTGSTASDVSSWEAVDEKEAKTTLWVPDHALATCMKCQTPFWFGRRKHHCRNCGGLFCHDCSSKFVPIPNEQLYHPVRICDECFERSDHKNCIGDEQEQNDSKDCETQQATEMVEVDETDSKSASS